MSCRTAQKALRFDQIAFAAFELHILKRPGAEADYTAEEQRRLRLFQGDERSGYRKADPQYHRRPAGSGRGLHPGPVPRVWRNTTTLIKRSCVKIWPISCAPSCRCAKKGSAWLVHPDDPPRPILGLPRIVSTIEDMQWLKETVDSINNGFTMCTGSYGVRADNDLVKMVEPSAIAFTLRICAPTCREETRKPSTRRRTWRRREYGGGGGCDSA
jgi:mannonate dehydratase